MYRTRTTALWIYLPDDVVTDILSRLPVKTLIKFRCVCKSWYSIIAHPTFITKHLNRSCLYTNINGYFQYLKLSSDKRIWCTFSDHPDVDDVDSEIPITSECKYYSLVGGLNGLVCLTYFYNFGRTIYLWNPSIRKYKTLSCFSSTFIPQVSLPAPKKIVVLGFGFHSQANEYKIVRILYCRDSDWTFILNSPPLVEVYTMSTDSWKKIETHVPCFLSNQEGSAFINGSVHWIASRSVKDRHHRDRIMSFDFGGEVFGEIMLPDYHIVEDEPIHSKPVVLKESLSLCVCFRRNGHCHIWVMREYGVAESWTKQFTIVMKPERILRPLGFMKNNELLLETDAPNRWERKLFSYDLENLHIKDLGIRRTECSTNIFPFIESLVLL